MSDRGTDKGLTEEQARQALHQAVEDVHLDPGSWETVAGRRRRQQRRHVLVVAVNLAVVLAVAAAVTPVVRDRLAPAGTTAPASTAPTSTDAAAAARARAAAQMSPVGPMHVLTSGSYRGKQWQFIAYQSRAGLCAGWNYSGNPGYRPGGNPNSNLPPFNGGGGCMDRASQPQLSIGASTGVGQPVLADGTVSERAVLVRVFLHHRGSPAVVTVQPVGRQLGLSFNFWVAMLPGTDDVINAKTVISKVVAYDRDGRPIAQADLKHSPSVPASPRG